ncbi:MAG TPA: S8 family serine peptidase, partial [Thermoanaerobaculia bacterium]|nr:S8 family serine peptidase [Thermoanaerobaculia bacterium]
MRRLTAVLLSLLLADVALAGVKEDPDREAKGRGDRFGRAMILQPKQVLTEADIADLASRGIKVTRAITEGRYIARVQDGVTATDDARIASLEPMTSRMKLHRSVVSEASLAKPHNRVNVIFHRDVDFEAARDAILASGGELEDVLQVKYSPGQRLTVNVSAATLQALVADERVMTIVGISRRQPRTENAVTAAVHNVTPLYSAPYGLSGEGVNVSLFELAEAQGSHVEFAGGRLTVNALGGTADNKGHATHVAGIIGAAGVNAAAKGMAPQTRIYQYCLPVSGQNQCEGDWLELKDEALTPLGIIADNNSWGFTLGWFTEGGFPVWDGSEIWFGSYIPDFGGPFVDDISIQRKVLFVHSAGNDG